MEGKWEAFRTGVAGSADDVFDFIKYVSMVSESIGRSVIQWAKQPVKSLPTATTWRERMWYCVHETMKTQLKRRESTSKTVHMLSKSYKVPIGGRQEKKEKRKINQ